MAASHQGTRVVPTLYASAGSRWLSVASIAILLGAGIAVAGPLPFLAATPDPAHPNVDLAALLDDADGNRVRDAIDELAARDPDAIVYLHVLYDRRPTSADVDVLTGLGAARTYIFSNWDWVKVEARAGDVLAMVAAPGVVAIEQFVPPVIQNQEAAWTTRVRETNAATSDGRDHKLAVHQDLGVRGEGMVVAILDTGVDNRHVMLDDLDDDPNTLDPKLVIKTDPATGDLIIGGADASDGFVVVGCVDPQDDHFHGTHVAGTAVGTGGRELLTGVTEGVAPQARLVDIDIAVPIGPGLLGGFVDPVGSAIGLGEDIAFDWLIDFNQGETCFGDPGEFAVDVASMSFGSGGGNPGITNNVGITDVVRSGITFTASAGNSGDAASTLSVGAEGAIIVAASDDRNTPSRHDDVLAWFSSRGLRPSDGDADGIDEMRPDIAAPGVGISSAFLHSGALTIGASGTSMAAPHVAGIATLMLQAADAAGRDLRPIDLTGNWRDMGADGAVPIRDLLTQSAEYREQVGAGDAPVQVRTTGRFGQPWNNGWGYGLVDAYDAVQLAVSGGQGTPAVAITSPADGQDVPAGSLRVEGIVHRDGAPAVDAGGPYTGVRGQPIPIAAIVTGGITTVTCAWEVDAGGILADPDACATTVTFPDAGPATLRLTATMGSIVAQDDADVTVLTGEEIGAFYLTATQTAQGTAVDCGPTPTYAMSTGAPTDAESDKAYLGRAFVALTCSTDFVATVPQPTDLGPAVDLVAWFGCDAPSAAPVDPVTNAIVPINIDFELAIDGTPIAGSYTGWTGPFVCDSTSIIPITTEIATGGASIPAGSTLMLSVSPWWLSPNGANDPAPNIHLWVGSTLHPAAIHLDGAGASAGTGSLEDRMPTNEVDDEEGDFAQPYLDITGVSIENDLPDTFDVVLHLSDLAGLPTNPVVAGFSFGADICADNNLYADAPVCYRLSASRELSGDTFGNAVVNKNGSSCGYGDLLQSAQIEDEEDQVRWTLPKAALNFRVPPDDINDCQAVGPPLQGWTRGGAPVADGTTISGIKGNTGTRLGGTVTGLGGASITFGNGGLLNVPQDDGVFGDTTAPGNDYVVGSANLPLAADAGGPYTGTVGAAIPLVGSFTGGDGSATCAWTGEGATFADASACATSVTFDNAGTYVATLTVQDATGQATDDATVEVRDVAAGERVDIVWGETLLGTQTLTTTAEDPEAGFDIGVDLPAPGPQTLVANWYDASGLLLGSDSVTVNVLDANEPPTAAIAGPTTAIEGQEVSFDGSASADSDGAVVSHAWDFGDGATGTGATATHAYAAAGTYVVTLTVTDDDGATGTATHEIVVDPAPPNEGPTAHIAGPARARGGQPVTFSGEGSTDPDGTVVDWTWDMGDGTVLHGAVVEHTYTKAGPKDIVLTVTDDDGATATATLRHVVQGG